MSYDDYASVERIASDGGTPDWNNQEQADGYRARQLTEERQPQYVPPPESPPNTETSSSWAASPAWEPAQPGRSPSQPWRPSSSGGTATTVFGQGLACLLVGLAGGAGGWIGHGYGQAQHWSGVQAWAAAGGGALGAALISATILLLVVAAVNAAIYVLKGITIVTWWLTVKLFWLIVIVGGVSVVGWTITVASCRGLGVCRSFFTL